MSAQKAVWTNCRWLFKWWLLADTQLLYVCDGCNHYLPPQFDTQSNQTIISSTCGLIYVFSSNFVLECEQLQSEWVWISSMCVHYAPSANQLMSAVFPRLNTWVDLFTVSNTDCKMAGEKCTVQAHENIMTIKKQYKSVTVTGQTRCFSLLQQCLCGCGSDTSQSLTFINQFTHVLGYTERCLRDGIYHEINQICQYISETGRLYQSQSTDLLKRFWYLGIITAINQHHN